MQSDYDHKQEQLMQAMHRRLSELVPDPIKFETIEQIEELTFDQAIIVIKAARRHLMFNFLHQETHEHWLDDCGDDTQAATENWTYLHNLYFSNDLDEAAVVEGVKYFLDPRERNNEDGDDIPFGGADGEIRFYLLSEELVNIHYDEMERRYREWKSQQ